MVCKKPPEDNTPCDCEDCWECIYNLPFLGADMSMKTIQMDELPNCALCKEEGKEVTAEYDVKTTMGPWAYLCEKHKKVVGTNIGTKLEKRVKIAAKQTDEIPKVYVSIVQAAMDSLCDVQCPHCGETHSVEPDANYVKKCENCNNKFQVVGAI